MQNNSVVIYRVCRNAIILFSIIASLVIHPHQAAADTKVILSRVISDELYRLIRQSDIENMDIMIDDHMEHYNLSRPDAIALIRRINLAATEFDIDEDGTPELITVVTHSINCGTAGCSSEIFEKIRGNWVSLGTGPKVFSPKNPNGPGSINVTHIEDKRWNYYPYRHPKYKALQKK